MGYFKSEKVSPSITKITDAAQVFSYLVEGSEKAMLIDSGIGLGNIREYAETLTDKPLSLILTHGHSDHAGGAAWFDKVYLSEADWELVSYHATMDMKYGYVEFMLGEAYKDVKKEDFCPERLEGFLPLSNGQVFDLGGVTLEAVAVPGHTQGMTCILFHEERSILFGDACNYSVFLWDKEASSVEDYLDSLLMLKQFEDRYDTVYLSHATTTVDKAVLDNTMDVCRDILSGRSDEMPFTFMEYSLLMAKKVDAEQNRIDGKIGNIVYNPNKIFRKSE